MDKEILKSFTKIEIPNEIMKECEECLEEIEISRVGKIAKLGVETMDNIEKMRSLGYEFDESDW